MIDYARLALRAMKGRGIRTLLTMIGVFIGMAAVVSLISLGQGMKNAINEQFELMGADKIVITPGNIFMIGGEGGPVLTESDLNVVKKTDGIKLAGGIVFKLGKVKFGNKIKYTWVTGIPLDESKKIVEDMQNFKLKSGRRLKNGDKGKAVIAIKLSEGDLFDKKVKLRDKLVIEGEEFKVIGSLDRIGNPQDDSQVVIPLEDAKRLFNKFDEYDFIIAQVQKGIDVDGVAEAVKKNLRKHRNVEKGKEDFTVQTSEQLLESFSVILTVVQAVLIGIAAISLVVGGIGIMNTMYTSVLERTKEIGVLKAIGARNIDILSIFLIESGFLGLIGGFVGILIGMFFSKVVEFFAFRAGLFLFKITFSWELIVGVLAFSFIVGSISGIFPAIQASKLKPVEALRYE